MDGITLRTLLKLESIAISSVKPEHNDNQHTNRVQLSFEPRELHSDFVAHFTDKELTTLMHNVDMLFLEIRDYIDEKESDSSPR